MSSELFMKSELFTIGSVIFSCMLLIIYLFQSNRTNTKSKLYRTLLYFNIVIGLVEILSIGLIDNGTEFGAFLLKIRLALLIIFDFIVYLYTLIYMCKNYEMTFKELLGVMGFKLLYVILLLAIVALMIQPNTDFLENGVLYFFSGYSECIYVGTVICILIILIIQAILRGKELKHTERTYLIMILLTHIVFTIHQMVFTDEGFLLLGTSSLLLLMYLVVENPDIEVLEELNKNNSNTEKYSGSKINFLSRMSEDIKKPLFCINGTIQNIMSTEEADENTIKGDIKKIETSGNELLDIMNNILAISNLDTGQEKLNKKEYAPKELFDKLIKTTNEKLSAKGVTLAVGIAENIPAKLNGDVDKINQILTNILNNAVEYTDTGKVTLVVSCDTIENVANLHFRINDTGRGISEANKATIFTKNDNDEKGGIGLLIVKNYIELMEGKIWFESKEHLGTTFYVDIPQEIGASETLSYTDLSGKRVLVVDDNRLNLTVAKKLLELHNLDVITATTGEECINLINSTMQFDLLFLDHSMPGMDGVETLKKIRTLNVRTKIPPIVAFTANAIEGMKEQYEQEGFDSYLSKPIDKNDLDKILAKYLK